MINVLRKISDWFKYERLSHYPALAAFDRDSALKRLKAYEREERKACKSWLVTAWVVIIVFTLLWLALEYFSNIGHSVPLLMLMPGWVLDYAVHRRIRRRVEAKVAAELGGGRLWKCVECGYDLRASENLCPECGAPVRVGPPAEAA